MASESSSAVLDMTDDCDTNGALDTEAAPVIMEHGYDIGVKVDSPMKQLSRLETFVTYRVRCTCARWASPAFVRRRYNHFKALHKRLSAQHPLLPIPPLPALHSARQQLDRYGAKFVALRAIALDAMLSRIARHPILTHSEDFRLFVTTPDEEIDSVLRSESSPLSLWGLGSVLSGGHDTNNGVRVKDPEFCSAYDYLQSLQQKLTTLSNLTSTLYKSHHALTNEYKGLVPDSWCTWETGVARGAVRACGAGAVRRAAVTTHTAHTTHTAPHYTHAALLSLLAAYCRALQDKLRARGALHAAHVAGTSTDDNLHNQLEQASEALRSELTDWNGKTKSEIKQILLDLANKQVSIHQQSLNAWEYALKMAGDPNPQELFKTVSKQCVQNLSPSKAKPDTPTDKDFDDLSLNSDENFIKVNADNDDHSIEGFNSNGNFDNTNEITDFFMGGNTVEVKNVEEKFSEESSSIVNNVIDSNEVKDNGLQEESVNEIKVGSDEVTEINKNITSDPLNDFAEIDLSEK